MDIQLLLNKAINFEFLSVDEGVFLYKKAPLNELMYIANKIRFKHNPEPKVSWIIDRNINISNICFVKCKFCNFCRSPNHQEAYITSTEEYITKINELKKWGGNQILLQGGLNPSNDLNFYVQLFKTLKKLFPEIKLHALSPPEIIHICKISKKNIEFVLEKLILAGLDSLPGGGAEILSDRVRKIISPAKCSSKEWLKVMQVAHKLNITTTATMMFGHIETIEERIMHLIKIRDI